LQGLEPSLRAEVWKFLLGYDLWNVTTEARNIHREEKRREYEKYKLQWTSVTQEQLSHWSKMKDKQSRIGALALFLLSIYIAAERDVVRTDRHTDFFAGDNNPNLKKLNDILLTYSVFNWDIGAVSSTNLLPTHSPSSQAMSRE
jgi:hypothetical protein